MAPTTTASPSQIQGQREGVPELFVDANLCSFPRHFLRPLIFQAAAGLSASSNLPPLKKTGRRWRAQAAN